MSMKNNGKMPSEHHQQCALIEWFRYAHPSFTIFAIPNGGIRNKITASKLKREGVMAGVADLYWMDYSTFIEMKKDEKCRQAESQVLFQQICKETGHRYILAYGFLDAIKKIEEVIKYGKSNLQRDVNE